jgi:hypothetical protein
MTDYIKTFPKMDHVTYTEAFPIGDANDHTFIVVVSDKKTSVDFNFQITLDGVNWADMNASDIQKTEDGAYLYHFEGYHGMAIRGAYKAEVGGTQATATVGTVVVTAINKGDSMNSYTVETKTGVAAGAEVVTMAGKAIVITANAASSLEQLQAALAANTAVAALVTIDGVTVFAAAGPTALATGDGAQLVFEYRGGE